jgi:ribosomal protein L44E
MGKDKIIDAKVIAEEERICPYCKKKTNIQITYVKKLVKTLLVSKSRGILPGVIPRTDIKELPRENIEFKCSNCHRTWQANESEDENIKIKYKIGWIKLDNEYFGKKGWEKIFFADGKYIEYPKDSEERERFFELRDKQEKGRLLENFNKNGGKELSNTQILLLFAIVNQTALRNSEFKWKEKDLEELIEKNYVERNGIFSKKYSVLAKGFAILDWIQFCKRKNIAFK